MNTLRTQKIYKKKFLLLIQGAKAKVKSKNKVAATTTTTKIIIKELLDVDLMKRKKVLSVLVFRFL